MIVYYNENQDCLFIATYNKKMRPVFCATAPFGEPEWTGWYNCIANTLNELRKEIKQRGVATIIHDDGEP